LDRRVYLSPSLTKKVEEVRRRDQDTTLAATARRLIRKALIMEGIKVEEEGREG
jgi:hypothetical protein